MSSLSDLLANDAVQADVAAANKRALFHQLGQTLGRLTGLGERDIVSSLSARERLGSTGFGAGVAIPHGRVAELDHVVGCFIRLSQPIDFQGIDGLPVDLVFALLSPPDAGADHLKALARVSRLLRDRQVLAKLRGARSRDAIYAVLSGADTRDAA